jgi:protein-tyrosine-phosphatase
VALRVAARWWPGPVTQVLGTTDGGTLGVRVPGHPWTRRLAERAGPLWLTSVNVSGAPAPSSVADMDPAVIARCAVVVDSGRTALGESSTVVQPYEVTSRMLREGVVSRRDLLTHAAGRVLVVCSGNTCRSPMAARLLQDAFDRLVAEDPALLPPEIASAGLATGGGLSATPSAVAALEARGLDLIGHRSRPVTEDPLRRTDLVLTMTRHHLEALRPQAAAFGFRVELFDPEGRDVEDPFGGPTSVYEQCARMLAGMAEARGRALTPPREARV